MPKKKKATPSRELTVAEEFYVKGNMEVVSDVKIAKDLDLPLKVVQDFIEQARVSRSEQSASRVKNLMQRHKSGAVAMTEAASMVIDDRKKVQVITQADVNKAAAEGNHKLAATLMQQMENQRSEEIKQVQAKYSDCWHFIDKDKGK